MIRSVRNIPDPPLPLLITGIAGVPGYNAFQYFREKFPGQVIGTRRVDNWPLRGEGIEACDIYDRDGVRRLFDKYQFASVLSAEGICKLKSCELDPEMARRMNVEGVQNLISNLMPQTRLVHISVDLVFSGDRPGDYLETDATDPVTIYGKSMAMGEAVLTRHRPDAAILRISLPMGISFNGHAGAIDWIQSRFKKSKPATLFFDEIRTPTYTDCLNQTFAAMLANNMSGIFHAGGPRKLSLYQIAQIVNRVGGYDPRHLSGCYRVEAGPVPPRAGDVTMNSAKLTDALGYAPFDPWPLYDDFVPTHRDWHHERPAHEAGSPDLLADVLYRNPK